MENNNNNNNNNINYVLGIESSPNQIQNKKTSTKYRIATLRTIANFYMVFAWIIGIATIVINSFFFSYRSLQIYGYLSLIVGILLTFGLAGLSVFIKIFIDIEFKGKN